MPNRMESVDMGALSKLINDINKFNEDMSDLTEKMRQNVDGMQENWNDPQYQEFQDYMYDSISSLLDDLDVMEETHIRLKRIYNILTTTE